jgi:hypothetical protein
MAMSNEKKEESKKDFNASGQNSGENETKLERGVDYDLDSSSMRLSEKARKILFGQQP